MTSLYQIGKVNSRNFFTFLDMYQNGKERHDSPMTIYEIRRENARWLAQQCGGAKKFADLLDLAEARVSHLIGKTPSKNIGNKAARKIERAFDRPEGWLDTPNAWVAESDEVSTLVKADEVARLVFLFAQSTNDGKAQILQAAELAEKNSPS
jgi:hypothetical protein